MRKAVILASIYMIPLFELSSAMAQDTDYKICATPLSAALLTVKEDSTSNSQTEVTAAWQCSFEFKNHDQAIAAGLKVGAIVYGAPLEVGGSWSQNTVDTWKQENCSQSARNASFEGATISYLKQVAPGAMLAFTECIRELHNSDTSTALICSVTRNPSNFTIKWRQMADEAASGQPIVRRMMVINGSCDPGISAKTKVGTGGVGTPCFPQDKLDMSVSVDTSRGNCVAIAEYPKKVFSVNGTITLDADRTISSDVVQFEQASKIVTNGHKLAIQTSELKIGPNAEIVAYDKEAARKPSQDGISGGSLALRTKSVTGDGDLKIDLSGQGATDGTAGSPGGRGGKGGNAEPRGWHGFKGCLGGHSGGRGGTGQPGSPGTQGGNGGDGGIVAVQVEGGATEADLTRIIIVGKDNIIPGGSKGIGGKGGPGGPGGPGGDSASGHQGCGTQPGGPSGDTGPNGPDGANGVDGKPGLITIQ